jgi:hypothetical protein
MHKSGSILRTFCERVRQYLDEPDLDARYDNDYLVRHIMGPSMVDVLSRISMMEDNTVLVRQTVSVVKGTEYYQLAPNMRSVWRIEVTDENGTVLSEALPRGEFHPAGANWKIEGNLLALRPFPGEDQEVDVVYEPSGHVTAHLADDGTLDADDTTFNLTTGTPLLGMVDRRPSAYVGSYLRTLDVVNPIEERIVATHDVVLGEVTVRVPLTSQSSVTSGTSEVPAVAYEIVPFLLEPLLEAIACRGAMKLGTGRNVSQARKGSIMLEYRSAVKTAYDNTANLQGRFGKFFNERTVDGRFVSDRTAVILHPVS